MKNHSLLIKGFSKAVKNEAKEQKSWLISMLLGTLGASLLGNLLMLPHPLAHFEKQKYYQNEPKFNGVYSINNLPKIKDGHM